MEVVIGSAAKVVRDGARHISRKACDSHMSVEYDWFAKVIENIGDRLNNHQFFTRIAKRPEAVGLLRWCLFVLKGSSELFWFCAEARNVYEAPTFSQPHLLKILKRYE